jgi:hypothetical protein
MPDFALAGTWERFPVLDPPLNDDGGGKTRHGGQPLRESVQCASRARNRMRLIALDLQCCTRHKSLGRDHRT